LPIPTSAPPAGAGASPAPEAPPQGLRQAVEQAVYASPRQRRRRRLAACLLLFKHAGRGMLLLWPLAVLALSGASAAPFWALALFPGALAWAVIVVRAWRQEVRQRVEGHILQPPDLRRLLTRDR